LRFNYEKKFPFLGNETPNSAGFWGDFCGAADFLALDIGVVVYVVGYKVQGARVLGIMNFGPLDFLMGIYNMLWFC